jgi:GTPase involved in cell partitioning and DNA repair
MGGGAGKRDGTEDDGDAILGGAAMAAHPFTTIDPNVGFCLVPAPAGSCPEDDESCVRHLSQKGLISGSTHGRDSKGRRLISLCLKDVAGLVPGAYQGHGKGNKVGNQHSKTSKCHCLRDFSLLVFISSSLTI